jgi:hypothetical protein
MRSGRHTCLILLDTYTAGAPFLLLSAGPPQQQQPRTADQQQKQLPLHRQLLLPLLLQQDLQLALLLQARTLLPAALRAAAVAAPVLCCCQLLQVLHLLQVQLLRLLCCQLQVASSWQLWQLQGTSNRASATQHQQATLTARHIDQMQALSNADG